MNEHELARRVSVLPDQFASRLDESTNDGLRSMNGGGEWDELMDLLVAALVGLGAAVTVGEQQELRELLEAMDMPADPIERLTVAELQPSAPQANASELLGGVRTTERSPSGSPPRTLPALIFVSFSLEPTAL